MKTRNGRITAVPRIGLVADAATVVRSAVPRAHRRVRRTGFAIGAFGEALNADVVYHEPAGYGIWCTVACSTAASGRQTIGTTGGGRREAGGGRHRVRVYGVTPSASTSSDHRARPRQRCELSHHPPRGCDRLHIYAPHRCASDIRPAHPVHRRATCRRQRRRCRGSRSTASS